MPSGPAPPPRPHPGDLLARLGPHTTTVEVEPSPYLRLDAEGRWTAYAEGGGRFRRALDGAVLGPRGRGHAPLPPDAAEAVHRRVEGTARRLVDLARTLPSDRLHVHGPRGDLVPRLERAAAWTAERRRADLLRFQAAWPEPALILPPHRTRDLVVLPALGCPNHGCTFCAFYRDRRFRPLAASDFSAHVDCVEAALGRARLERDGVFLGSASALSLPDAVLADRLATLGARWGRPRRGVASFLDPEHAPRRDATAWRALGDLGLCDVTIGLETGDPALRAAAGKSADLARLWETVRDLHDAALRVCVTVLVGLGGEAAAERHRAASVAAVAALDLRADDLVYLSPLADALPADRLRAEEASLRGALRDASEARVSAYPIERYAWLS